MISTTSDITTIELSKEDEFPEIETDREIKRQQQQQKLQFNSAMTHSFFLVLFISSHTDKRQMQNQNGTTNGQNEQ